MKKENELLNLKVTETIVLTRRGSRQILDLIENPPPPTEKFLEAQARYQARATQWVVQNSEAIESSNAYVETHGLPLEKVRKF